MKELIELTALVVLAVSVPVGISLFYKAYKRRTIIRLLNGFSKRDRIALLTMGILLWHYMNRAKTPDIMATSERIAEISKKMADSMVEKLNEK